MDGAIFCIMRRADPLDELLNYNDGAVQSELDRITKMAARERGEEPALVDTRPESTEEAALDGLESEFCVALQSCSLKQDDIKNMTSDTEEILKDFQEKAAKLVAQSVRLIDGSLKDVEVSQQLRMSHIGRMDATNFKDGSLVIFYDVKASGEQHRRPALRPPVFDKKSLDRLMSLALTSRLPELPKGVKKEEQPPPELEPNTVVVLMDAFREGNAHGLLSSLRVNDKVRPCV